MYSASHSQKSVTFKGGVVFAGGREMKIFSTVFRDFGGKKWSGNGIFNTRRPVNRDLKS